MNIEFSNWPLDMSLVADLQVQSAWLIKMYVPVVQYRTQIGSCRSSWLSGS